ncbi:MAG TPA: hypothetical protein VMN36_04505 [Verrucomicrobiales bacterium]|nr:hypothetical protein [Verrucomicrobiales bacterium]
MSLKGFHIVFITVSVLLTLGFSWWCLSIPESGREPVVTWMGYGSAAGCVALLVYGIWFVRKARSIIV